MFESVGKTEIGISLYVGLLLTVCIGVHMPYMPSLPDTEYMLAVPRMPDMKMPSFTIPNIDRNMPDIKSYMPEFSSLSMMNLKQNLPNIQMPDISNLYVVELTSEGLAAVTDKASRTWEYIKHVVNVKFNEDVHEKPNIDETQSDGNEAEVSTSKNSFEDEKPVEDLNTFREETVEEIIIVDDQSSTELVELGEINDVEDIQIKNDGLTEESSLTEEIEAVQEMSTIKDGIKTEEIEILPVMSTMDDDIKTDEIEVVPEMSTMDADIKTEEIEVVPEMSTIEDDIENVVEEQNIVYEESSMDDDIKTDEIKVVPEMSTIDDDIKTEEIEVVPEMSAIEDDIHNVVEETNNVDGESLASQEVVGKTTTEKELTGKLFENESESLDDEQSDTFEKPIAKKAEDLDVKANIQEQDDINSEISDDIILKEESTEMETNTEEIETVSESLEPEATDVVDIGHIKETFSTEEISEQEVKTEDVIDNDGIESESLESDKTDIDDKPIKDEMKKTNKNTINVNDFRQGG